MTTRVLVYNLALGHLGERKLATATENREPRRVLDDYWDHLLKVTLEEAYWNHAIRAVQAEASASVTPAFGWTQAFTIPTDWVRTVEVSENELFKPALGEFAEESGYWYANTSPIYVRYVSSSTAYGADLSRWGGNFESYFALLLAQHACVRITGSDSLLKGPEGIIKRCNKARIKAKSIDAMNEAPKRPPTGSWARSRSGYGTSRFGPNGDGYDD